MAREYGVSWYETDLGADAVRAGRLQLALSTRVLGRRHHLHRLGDLLDVFDGAQTHRDGLEGGHCPLLLLLLQPAETYRKRHTSTGVKLGHAVSASPKSGQNLLRFFNLKSLLLTDQ